MCIYVFYVSSVRSLPLSAALESVMFCPPPCLSPLHLHSHFFLPLYAFLSSAQVLSPEASLPSHEIKGPRPTLMEAQVETALVMGGCPGDFLLLGEAACFSERHAVRAPLPHVNDDDELPASFFEFLPSLNASFSLSAMPLGGSPSAYLVGACYALSYWDRKLLPVLESLKQMIFQGWLPLARVRREASSCHPPHLREIYIVLCFLNHHSGVEDMMFSQQDCISSLLLAEEFF